MKYFITLIICCISFPVFCQDFTEEDVEQGYKSYLNPVSYKNLQWKGNTDDIIYSVATDVFEVRGTHYKKSRLFNLDDINQVIVPKGKTAMKSIPLLTFYSETQYGFYEGNSFFLLDTKNKVKCTEFNYPEESKNSAFNYIKKTIAYSYHQNIWLLEEDHVCRQITFDTSPGICNGDIVYREEFGSEKGIFWSPSGNYIAFYRKDESGIPEYPVIHYKEDGIEFETIRYPMAGGSSQITEVWIYSLNKDTLVRLQIDGEPDQYHTNLSWSPDENSIYIQHLNRNQNQMRLKSYSVADGSLIKEIFSEFDEEYVEPMHPLEFLKTETGNFIYQSKRDGFNHLYYYTVKADSLLQLTAGDWEVTDLLGLDETEQFIFFRSTEVSPMERHLFRLDRQTGKTQQLTSTPGTHRILTNQAKSLYIDVFQSITVPARIDLCDSRGQMLCNLLEADNPVKNYRLGKVEYGTIKAADDSTDLYYRLTKPVDFDSAKKYPVIIYVYGGPHVQLINNTWMQNLDYFQQYFAQRGYFSFTVDCRGSDNRGKNFEEVIYRQLGIPQIEDQMKGIEFLKGFSFIDTTRIGMYGWSFGGYMTISMMVKLPGVIKAGVAGGSVTNWKYYEVMYGERYMDKPSENPEGYALTNLSSYVNGLTGKLLIVHGTIDDVVLPLHSMNFIESCINKGIMIDCFDYPTQDHSMSGASDLHLLKMIDRYFQDNL